MTLAVNMVPDTLIRASQYSPVNYSLPFEVKSPLSLFSPVAMAASSLGPGVALGLVVKGI